jgi:hypothetical protein
MAVPTRGRTQVGRPPEPHGIPLPSAVKGLFSGKGTTQIGPGNRAVSGGSTSGANSPVVTAGRDVHFNAPVPVAGDEDAEVFTELEGLMPDLLGEMRKDLAAQPLSRIMMVLDKKTMAYNWPDPHFFYSADEIPDLWSKVKILQNHGLLREIKDEVAYRMPERPVKYLRRPPAG